MSAPPVAIGQSIARVWPSFRQMGPATASTGFALQDADWRLLAVLFIVSRLLIAGALVLAYFANTARMESGIEDLFCNWDCDWYLGLAEHGYQRLGEAGASGAANWVFFPLLPILMREVSQLTGLPAVWAGLAIAQIAWGTGLYLMFLAARDLRGAPFARHASVIYAVWPLAIHSSIPMTEALFVPLSIAVFLFARRGSWLLAAIAVALISATRTVGVILEVPLIMLGVGEFGVWRLLLLRPGTERTALALGAAGIGLAFFIVYLYGVTGDALAFSHNQVAWGRTFKWPWLMMIDELNPATIGANWLIANGLDLASGFGALALLWLLWRRGLKPEAIFAGATLLIAFDTGNASSLPRYAGGLYPVLLAVALLSDAPLRRIPVYSVLAAGLVCLSVAWGLEQFYVM